jgi:hypothetical protein
VNEEQPTQGARRKPSPWVGFIALALVVGAAVAAYIAPEGGGRRGQGDSESKVEVTRGTSCDALDGARSAFQDGSRRKFVTFVRQAERAALEALGTDFVVFGRAEEMALRIGAEEFNEGFFESGAQERIGERLNIARSACQKLAS